MPYVHSCMHAHYLGAISNIQMILLLMYLFYANGNWMEGNGWISLYYISPYLYFIIKPRIIMMMIMIKHSGIKRPWYTVFYLWTLIHLFFIYFLSVQCVHKIYSPFAFLLPVKVYVTISKPLQVDNWQSTASLVQ